MSASQRVYKARIASTKSLQQMFKAMELIAASRIGRARDRAEAARPYVEALTRAVSAVATHSDAEHPIVQARTETNRAALLLLTSDRGMAGDRKSTRLNSSHVAISYAVFSLKKKKI